MPRTRINLRYLSLHVFYICRVYYKPKIIDSLMCSSNGLLFDCFELKSASVRQVPQKAERLQGTAVPKNRTETGRRRLLRDTYTTQFVLNLLYTNTIPRLFFFTSSCLCIIPLTNAHYIMFATLEIPFDFKFYFNCKVSSKL